MSELFPGTLLEEQAENLRFKVPGPATAVVTLVAESEAGVFDCSGESVLWFAGVVR
jgi:hypothetical protein